MDQTRTLFERIGMNTEEKILFCGLFIILLVSTILISNEIRDLRNRVKVIEERLMIYGPK